MAQRLAGEPTNSKFDSKRPEKEITTTTVGNKTYLDVTSSSAIGLVITNAIDEIAYDLNASAFSETTDVSNDYILDNIELNFSTTESKTITITTSDGTTIWTDTNTNQSILLSNLDIGFNANDNVTVAVTQFSSPGTMDCILKIKQGTSTLIGDPVLGAGTEHIGSVDIDNLPTDYATSSKQLPDDHNVTVSNMIPAVETGLSTSVKQDDIITELQKKADLDETQPVSIATLPLPSGGATSDNQTNGNQKTQIVDSDGTSTTIKENSHTGNGELLINFEGHICADNSTSTPLAADTGGTDHIFTGDWQDTLDYNTITVGINSDADSAEDGLCICWSADGITENDNDVFTILADKPKVFTFSPARRYFKVTYTNGIVAQTTFNIQAQVKRGGFKPSSHRIKDSIVADDDAELMKSVITGERDDGVFSNATLSNSNRLRVVSQPYTYAIAEGDIADHRPLRRFGHNPTVGTSLETVTTDSKLYAYLTSAEYLEIVSTSASDDIAGVGMQSIFIQGLDGDYNIVNEIVELDGTTPVYTTAHQYIRLLAAYGQQVGTTPGNVGTITISNNAGTNILGTLPIGEGRWNAAVMTVPAGGTVYITNWYGSENSGKGSEVSMWKREFGDGGWQLIRLYTIIDNVFENEIKTPLVFEEKTDIEIRAQSNQGGANVAAGFYGWIE